MVHPGPLAPINQHPLKHTGERHLCEMKSRTKRCLKSRLNEVCTYFPSTLIPGEDGSVLLDNVLPTNHNTVNKKPTFILSQQNLVIL